MKVHIAAIFLFFTASLSSQTVQIKDSVRFLALGDSYTIGESVPSARRWPVQLLERIAGNYQVEDTQLDIIARTGWTTANLKNGISEQLDESTGYNLVSLLIGVNNQYQGLDFELYEPHFRWLLDKAIEAAGGKTSQVFVVSIPDYAYTPLFNGVSSISEELDKYNMVNKNVAEEYGVSYVNVTPISRQGLEKRNYVADDGLHPSGSQYAEWVSLMIETLFAEQVSGMNRMPVNSAF